MQKFNAVLSDRLQEHAKTPETVQESGVFDIIQMLLAFRRERGTMGTVPTVPPETRGSVPIVPAFGKRKGPSLPFPFLKGNEKDRPYRSYYASVPWLRALARS